MGREGGMPKGVRKLIPDTVTLIAIHRERFEQHTFYIRRECRIKCTWCDQLIADASTDPRGRNSQGQQEIYGSRQGVNIRLRAGFAYKLLNEAKSLGNASTHGV